MNVSKLVAAVLAVLVVSTGVGAVAATPNGNAPDDAAGTAANAPADDVDTNATAVREGGTQGDDAADEGMTDPQNASEMETSRDRVADAEEAEERRGPPADLPEQVPDHVSELHQRIITFLDGELEDLGAAVSDVTPDEGSENAADGERAENAADQQPTETATPTPEA